jgi:hypothetical protein
MNTVAVEVHQTDSPSLDLAFDLAIEATRRPAISHSVLANDFDPESNEMTANVVAGPFHGMLQFNDDGSFDYTPDAGFTGVDQFSYVTRDAVSMSVPTRVVINVGGVNLPPAAAQDRYRVTPGLPFTVSAASGVLANDSDPNGNALTAQILTPPINGTLVLNADGSFTYTSGDDFAGIDTLQYTASDGISRTAPVSVVLNVRPPADPINSVPHAVLDRYQMPFDASISVNPDGGVLANDSDAEGQPLVATLVAPPRHGTLELGFGGEFSYQPLAGFHGTDSFTYRADDGNTTTAPTMVLVEVLSPGAAQSERKFWLASDANRDGRFDAADVTFVLRRQFTRLGMADYDPAADVNGDGRVSMKDAIAVRNLLGESHGIAAAPAAVINRFDTVNHVGAFDEVISQWPIAFARPNRRHFNSLRIVPRDSVLESQPLLRASRQPRLSATSARTAFDTAFRRLYEGPPDSRG